MPILSILHKTHKMAIIAPTFARDSHQDGQRDVL